eukprot:CAMPEP_0201483548 /NCGR_PEP_ID=MMETSP0151_2-20130828/7744_1 /ASSEMBLY_ACC=CAM_ASM_000257 /TAXON_ID=200890 /ORGANISM="Paramoeba atlantica, Strain 621/1 / CCAP 1560/9" /LENGTH=778 /DNA_ID=CAMNT_0047866731 /DNA_START=283 /DNA_END=2619 /DNA_ORIENTATION=+
MIVILPGAFPGNTTLFIEVIYHYTVFTHNEEQSFAASTTSTITVLSSDQTVSSLFGGYFNSLLFLRTTFYNINFFSDVEYGWDCLFLSDESESSCPPCPTGESENTAVASLPLELTTVNGNCVYQFESALVFTSFDSFQTTSSQLIIRANREIPTPIILLNERTSTCVIGYEGESLQFYIDISVLDQFVVDDIVWRQTQGPFVILDCSEGTDCGGNGTTFLYIIPELITSCETYSWDVDVSIRHADGGDAVSVTTVSLCEVGIVASPKGGFCSIESLSEDCTVDILSTVTLQCMEWEVTCGESFPLSSLPNKVSHYSGELIPNGIDSLHFTVPHSLIVGADENIIVEICNGFACSFFGPILVTVCPFPNEESRQDRFGEMLEQIEQNILINRLENALLLLSALGDAFQDCSSQSQREQDQMESFIVLNHKFYEQSLALVDGVPTRVSDTTILLNTWAIIGEKSCTGLSLLFDTLSLVCFAPTTTNVASSALDSIYGSLVSGVSDSETDEDQIVDLFDEALSLNECFQMTTVPFSCGESTPGDWIGDSFSYIQEVVSLESFSKSRVVLSIPGGEFIFPQDFQSQIIESYQTQTNDKNVPFSCVVMNIIQSPSLLESDLKLNSPIVGLVAIVVVNGTPLNLLLGHSKPLKGVIVRLYFADSDSDRSSGPRFQLTTEEKREGCEYYLGNGDFDPDGLKTLKTTQDYIECSCPHFSNFGLLFEAESDSWTTLRILSLALLAFAWMIILVVFLLVTFSQSFREFFHFESHSEVRSRVLGDSPE